MFGSDGSPIVQYVVIFAVIFTALAGIVFVVRRLTGQTLPLPGRSGARGRQPRLGIVDVYELDRARQLILLRRDNVEHLLLVGGPNDVVVERNIQRGQRPLPEAALRSEPAAEALAEPLPDPLAGAGRLPEPQRALPEVPARRSEPLFDPGFKMPVVVPAPVAGSGSAPPVTLPLDAGLLGGDEPGQEVAASLTIPLRAEVAAAAPPAPERERFSARRILSRATPPPLDPRPEPASERRPDAPVISAGPEEPPAAYAPPPPPPRERRSVDASILSDMARQLQAALARPASAVTPAPPPAAAPASPAPSDEPVAVDPVAAAMAATLPAAEPAPPVPDEPPPAPQQPAPPPPASIAAPAAPPALPRAVLPPVPSPAASPPQPSEPAPAPEPLPPGANAAGNPFSVEEIEAEFARLLGRPLDKRG